MTIEIFRERMYDHSRGTSVERYDEVTIDQLIDMHCAVSYRQSVDLLISFMKFQISLDPDKYFEYISHLADQHDYRVEQTEAHPLCSLK